MRHYLIDFENTHTRGLKLEQLMPGDHVHIFYSKAASKLDMSALPSGIQVNIDFFEVLTGKQALDMQLSSYLGYLVKSANGDNSIGITIVSCDTDYDTVVAFWKKNIPGIQLERLGLPQGQPKKAAAQRTRKKADNASAPAEEAAPELPAVTDIEAPAPELPSEPEEEPVLKARPFMTVKEVYVPEVFSPAEEEESFSHILNELQEEEALTPDVVPAAEEKKTPQKANAKKTRAKKQPAKKAEEKPSQKTDARTELNNQIIQVLAKNRIEANTAGSVAKLILAHQSEKNGKQIIYREIIKKYRQEQGLQIYNLVKELF